MCENVVHGTEHDHENRKNGRMCLQSSTMSEHIEITPEIIEIRHYLHAHPERSFKEYETSAYIEKLLRAHDIEVLNNPLETGVVGLIRGDQPDHASHCAPISMVCPSRKTPVCRSHPSTTA